MSELLCSKDRFSKLYTVLFYNEDTLIYDTLQLAMSPTEALQFTEGNDGIDGKVFTEVKVRLEMYGVPIEYMWEVQRAYKRHSLMLGGNEFNTFPFTDLGLANSRIAMLEAAIYSISHTVYMYPNNSHTMAIIPGLRKTVSDVMRSQECTEDLKIVAEGTSLSQKFKEANPRFTDILGNDKEEE